MKKFKFFALAALLGMSINAMAAWDLKNEKSTDTFTYVVDGDNAMITGFVNGLSNSKMATVTIPATISGKGSKTYNVVAIDGTLSKSTKFAGNTKIKKVVLAANSNLTTICAGSFQGASNLATVTLTNGSKLKAIEAAAFDGTAITTLDLTPTIVEDLNQIFTSVDEETEEVTRNKKLTTVKLAAKTKFIKANAFDHCMQLATVDFTKCNQDLTIEASAFNYCLFFTELELPACVSRIADGALTGSRITKLTINANSGKNKPTIGAIGGEKLTSIIVNGAFQGKFGIGNKPEEGDGDAPAVCVSNTVTSLTFNGAVAGGALGSRSFAEAGSLATVTFSSTLAEGAVAAEAFGYEDEDGFTYAGQYLPYNWAGGYQPILTVTYLPTEGKATKVKSFHQEAFITATKTNTWTDDEGTEHVDGIATAKLATATWYKTWIEENYEADETYFYIYGAQLSAAAETKTIEVANNGEGKYYYGTFFDKDGWYKIAAAQNDGKVMVYGAYVDEIKNGNSWDNQVYMQQLKIYGGYYWIPAWTPVVIKSTTSDDVTATLVGGGPDSQYYQYEGGEVAVPANKITVTSEELYGLELKEYVSKYGPYEGKGVAYILAPFEEYGFQWSKFADTRLIPEGTFYIVANNGNPEYPARLNVIWTDGSEDEATAIKTVKKANAENGAQYNLAGQKVNAAYKGIIIKDGKKMIQK